MNKLCRNTSDRTRFKLSAVTTAILATSRQMTAPDASASTYAPANCSTTTKATIGQVSVTGTNAQPVDGSGTWSNILGCDTSGNGLNAVSVFGTYSKGTGNGSAVFGFSGTAGQWASAFGLSADASGTGSTALGFGSQAQSLNSVAIGGAGGDGTTALPAASSTTASGTGAIAIGSNSIKGAQAAASDSIAIGGQSSVASSATSGVAIGLAANVSGSGAVAIGATSSAAGQNSVALGNGAAAKYDGSVAIGAASSTADSLAALQGVAAYAPSAGAAVSGATPAGEVSVGTSGGERRLTNVAAGGAPTDAVNVSQLSTSTASLSTSLSMTNSAVASLSTSTSTGLNTATSRITSLSTSLNTTNSRLGSLSTSVDSIYNTGTKYFHANSTAGDSVASGQRAVAIGPQSTAGGANSFAAGSGARATANGAVAMGLGAQATGTNAIAIGTGALATGSQAIGVDSRAGGGGVALGDNADAGGTPLSRARDISRGTAIGLGALVQRSEGVALGSGSVASTAAGVAGYLPANAPVQQQAAVKATTSTQAAASVGDAANGQFRQITGVAAGAADSDATNLAQLKASEAAVKAGSVQYATNPDGSVNYSQIMLGNGQAPGGTRISNVAAGILPGDAVNVQQLNQVRSQVGDVARIAYSGTAMAFAMSGTYLPTLSPGEKTVGVGVGSYKGYSALALTFKALTGDGRLSWGAGVSTTGKEWGFNAGVGWKWK
ncbi:MAG TPA: YadA-like family protein [Variovorax sp.]